MSALPDFYDADRLEQLAIILFHGCGYNFYRVENQIRADDQRVRVEVMARLGDLRASVDRAEADWRRTQLPAPTREHPRLDPQAVAGAQRLERLSAAIGALSGQVAAQPVPENDRMTQRYRNEADTLARLIACDKRLVGQAELLRTLAEGRTATLLLDDAAGIEAGLAAMTATLRDRRDALA